MIVISLSRNQNQYSEAGLTPDSYGENCWNQELTHHNIALQWLIVGQMHTIYLQLLNYSTAFATVECTIRAEVVYCEAKQFQKSFSGMFKLSLQMKMVHKYSAFRFTF